MPAKKTTTTARTTTRTPAPKKPKAKKGEAPPPAGGGGKRMSALDAAAKVLGEKGTAMTCPDLVGVMAAKGYWSSPNGKTPAATLNAAILREIAAKGKDARFAKTAPGRFACNDSSAVGIATAPLPTKKGKPKKPAKAATAKAGSPVAATIPDGTPGPESMAELFRI